MVTVAEEQATFSQCATLGRRPFGSMKLIRPSPSAPIVIDTSLKAKWSGSPIVDVVADVQAMSRQWATSRWPTDSAG